MNLQSSQSYVLFPVAEMVFEFPALKVTAMLDFHYIPNTVSRF
jgi:hypothetical protein